MEKNEYASVYNNITSESQMAKVNPENIQLEEDFLDYLTSVDRAESTIKQYKAVLHIFWVWNLENNNNKSFVHLTKREITKFQNQGLNVWEWSNRRMRTVKAVMRSLENYILNILDDEYPNYKKIWDKIESPIDAPAKPKNVMSRKEWQTLLDKLVERQEYAKACLIALGLNSGRRKAELCRFKVSYFSDENLICNGAMYKSPERVKTKGHGSKGKLLYVYTLAKPFKPYLDLWMEQREKAGIKSDWLFPMEIGGKIYDCPMRTTQIDSWFRQFCDIMGKHIFPHMLRHRFTTHLSENGIPATVIKDIVGWSDVSLVSVYDDTEAEDNFDKYFGEEGIKKVVNKGISDLE